MHIFLIFFLVPLGLGALLEYALCRFPRKRFWRRIPPVVLILLGIAVTLYRHFGWDADGGGAPVETLLFFPGLPLLGLILGLIVGWRLWKHLWTPRVYKAKKFRKTGGKP